MPNPVESIHPHNMEILVGSMSRLEVRFELLRQPHKVKIGMSKQARATSPKDRKRKSNLFCPCLALALRGFNNLSLRTKMPSGGYWDGSNSK